MRIMIMNCSKKDFWYKNSIGKTLEVKREDKNRYYVNQKGVLVSVLKTDAELI
jgi:hypothetical protein